MYDLVIHGGTVIDGTGDGPKQADVAVHEGRIVAVEPVIDRALAAESIDANGCIVTPGFVDVHTHYDGQITWDEALDPSASHGVTTVITGNCGVGFAPVRPGSQDRLIELMEGVEDIPGAALHEGMTWGWESFPEYLDVLRPRQWSMDVGVQLPHGPLRAYVMGDRATTQPVASDDDVAAMAELAREAMVAGAFGFTTSRTWGHASLDGTPVPGTFAGAPELLAIGRAVRDGGGRVFEVAAAGITPQDDPEVVATELDWIGALALETGLTATFIVLQHDTDPTRWQDEMAVAKSWRDRGAKVVPLVAGRPFGVLLGWDVRHPFRLRPTYEQYAHLPIPERIVALRDPSVRAQILSEEAVADDERVALGQAGILMLLPRCYVLAADATPDYEQPPSQSIVALAEAAGTSTEAIAYDALCEGAMLLLPYFGYSDGSGDALFGQMSDPDAVLGLADGGAHCGAICDASIPTYVLSHWARDRTRGARLPLADAVRRLTSQPADLYGLSDRGRIAVGLRADINVIDHANLRLDPPRSVADLPAGGIRLLQDAHGYKATIVNGVVTRLDDRDTGARPGRLLTPR